MSDLSVVLSADPWEMADERTGELRRGLSVWFVNQYRDSRLGQKPTKVSADVDLLPKLAGRLPAVCEMHFSTRPGAQNKAQLVLGEIEIIRPVDFELLLETGSV